MHDLSILYTPVTEKIKKNIEVLKSIFTEQGHNVHVKSGNKVAVPDILRSDIIIFATDNEQKLKEDFAEILRALPGINLAGRICGFVSFVNKGFCHCLRIFANLLLINFKLR